MSKFGTIPTKARMIGRETQREGQEGFHGGIRLNCTHSMETESANEWRKHTFTHRNIFSREYI